MKRTLSIILLIAMLLTAGCAPEAQPSPTPTQAAQPVQSVAPVTDPAPAQTKLFTDSTGREIELPGEITRVAPAGVIAQMYMLALAPELMCSIPAKFPAEAEKYIGSALIALPMTGQFYGDGANINMEEMAALAPDIVLDIGETKKTMREDMDSVTQSTGLSAIHITASLDQAGEAFRMLGRLLDKEAEAEALALYCEGVLADTQSIMAQVDSRVKLLYCRGEAGQNVIAKGSFQAETINLVGDNLADISNPSSKGTGNEVNMEQMMLWNPEVILFEPGSNYNTVADDPAWKDISAIKTGKYYLVPFGPYNWMGFPPSLNRFLGLLWATKLLYPDVAQFDLYEKVADYYKLFYHYELTKEDYNELVTGSINP